MQRLVFVILTLVAVGAWAHDYLGPESCQACHPAAYAAWQNSAHARARQVLSPQQQKDVRCQSCHSPNEAEQKGQISTVETCHGGGQYYSSTYVMKDAELARLDGLFDPNGKACRSCHDNASPSLKTFDFAAKLKAIDHWTAEREKRKAQSQ